MAEPPDLLAIADELYALPLAEFTPARDARAKELKGSDAAPAVKALRKPSLAAWVVNLLVRREAEQVEQVLGMGEALRRAQESMSGDDLRDLTRQRRQLTAAVTQQARSLASDAGVRVTQAVADQVEATLTAAMVEESCARAVRSGLLLAALAATGVDEVDVAAAVALPDALGFEGRGFTATPRDAEPARRPDLRVVPDPEAEAKALAAARTALEEADAELAQAEEAHRSAASEVEDLQARGLQLQAEADELKRRLTDLENAAEDLDDELGDAEDVRDEAASALREVEQARDRAQAALARLEGPTSG